MYIGYPIYLGTALTIFGYEVPPPDADATPQYKALWDHLKSYDLDLYIYDKGLYILGKHINEFHAGNNTHYSVNDAIELMIMYKQKVKQNLLLAGANLAEFTIEAMEGESTTVQNPEPYVIT